MTRVGVCLSGCGVNDGSEIHESVITLLALDRAGAEVVFMAPDIDQMHVVDHRTGEPIPGEVRNVLVESARIARGEIRDVAEVQASDLDALIFPGGFGAALNLCTFGVDGPTCTVHPAVAQLTRAVHQAGKPIGAMCIAPALMAKIFEGVTAVNLTIGTDAATAEAIGALGARHTSCPVTEFVVDRENKLVTTPAYMLAQRISEAAEGIEKMVKTVLEMA